MSKKNQDKSKIAVKIIAAILAIILVAAFAGTLIYYIVAA